MALFNHYKDLYWHNIYMYLYNSVRIEYPLFELSVITDNQVSLVIQVINFPKTTNKLLNPDMEHWTTQTYKTINDPFFTIAILSSHPPCSSFCIILNTSTSSWTCTRSPAMISFAIGGEFGAPSNLREPNISNWCSYWLKSWCCLNIIMHQL